jgi:hypothetical protein
MLTPPMRAIAHPTNEKLEIITSDRFIFNEPSTLALLVARILADHPNHTVTLHNLAVAAHALYRCQYFHLEPLSLAAYFARKMIRPLVRS